MQVYLLSMHVKCLLRRFKNSHKKDLSPVFAGQAITHPRRAFIGTSIQDPEVFNHQRDPQNFLLGLTGCDVCMAVVVYSLGGDFLCSYTKPIWSPSGRVPSYGSLTYLYGPYSNRD